MDDYLIARFIQGIIMWIVALLIICSLVYGWWIDDHALAFKQIYIEPMQYLTGLIMQPITNKVEGVVEQVASTTNQ